MNVRADKESRWKPQYPVITSDELLDKIHHSGNIPNKDCIVNAIISKVENSTLEPIIGKQQRYLQCSNLVVDLKLLEELEFDLFEFFSAPNSHFFVNHEVDRSILLTKIKKWLK